MPHRRPRAATPSIRARGDRAARRGGASGRARTRRRPPRGRRRRASVRRRCRARAGRHPRRARRARRRACPRPRSGSAAATCAPAVAGDRTRRRDPRAAAGWSPVGRRSVTGRPSSRKPPGFQVKYRRCCLRSRNVTASCVPAHDVAAEPARPVLDDEAERRPRPSGTSACGAARPLVEDVAFVRHARSECGTGTDAAPRHVEAPWGAHHDTARRAHAPPDQRPTAHRHPASSERTTTSERSPSSRAAASRSQRAAATTTRQAPAASTPRRDRAVERRARRAATARRPRRPPRRRRPHGAGAGGGEPAASTFGAIGRDVIVEMQVVDEQRRRPARGGRDHAPTASALGGGVASSNVDYGDPNGARDRRRPSRRSS